MWPSLENRASYSSADAKLMKKYGSLGSGRKKNNWKESRISPDFKSRWKEKEPQKRRLESEVVQRKRLFQKMFPVALPFECGEDLSTFIGRDHGVKRKSKDRKQRREN